MSSLSYSTRLQQCRRIVACSWTCSVFCTTKIQLDRVLKNPLFTTFTLEYRFSIIFRMKGYILDTITLVTNSVFAAWLFLLYNPYFSSRHHFLWDHQNISASQTMDSRSLNLVVYLTSTTTLVLFDSEGLRHQLDIYCWCFRCFCWNFPCCQIQLKSCWKYFDRTGSFCVSVQQPALPVVWLFQVLNI